MPHHEGRVAVVTGAAQGIGLGVSQRLAENGSAIVMVDIDADLLSRSSQQLADQGATVLAIPADVAEHDQVEAFIEGTISAFGGVDILVNNAADLSAETFGRDTDVETIPLDVWERTMAVNLLGPMLTCRHALPHLIERSGSIVNITTIGAMRGRWNQVAYGVSKAGLNALTEYVATTYGRRNVRCNAVAPGLVMSPIAERNMSEQVRQASARDRLIARAGTAADIANAVHFLVSDEASYITGQVLVVDGGTINHVPGYGSHFAATED